MTSTQRKISWWGLFLGAGIGIAAVQVRLTNIAARYLRNLAEEWEVFSGE